MILAYTSRNEAFYVEADTSGEAVGGVLYQMDSFVRLKPIAFFSSMLNEFQRKYCAGEREALAIVLADRMWGKHLEAAGEVGFLSDHNPLVRMRGQRDPRGKFSRWLLELESFRYRIEYSLGSSNCAGDYLSRSSAVFDSVMNDEVEHFERHFYPLTGGRDGFMEKIREKQATDCESSDAIKQLREKGQVGEGHLKRHDSWIVSYRLLCNFGALFVSISLRERTLNFVNLQSHPGMYRSCSNLGSFGEGWSRIQRGLASCLVCLRNKRSSSGKQPLILINECQRPRAMVAFDIATLPWAAWASVTS